MQLKWGTYAFAANSVEVMSKSELVVSTARIPIGRRTLIECRGDLLADGEAALTLAQQQLEAALAIPYQDLILFQNSGARSATLMLNSRTLGGTLVVSGPHFPKGNMGEYATHRSFSFTVEGEFPLASATNALVSFRERLVYSGGGPFYVMKRAVNGKPQRQMVYPETEYVVVQTGEAVGYLRRPEPPPSKWPQWLKQRGTYGEMSPERVGLQAYKNFGITWEYVHESLVPLIGEPTLWVG